MRSLRGEHGWTVRAGDRDAEFDEVILATGHAADWTGALRHGWNHAAPLVERGLSGRPDAHARVDCAGRRVAARGFALTFIDMALALTEGRGGSVRSRWSRACATALGVGARGDSAVLAHRSADAGQAGPAMPGSARRAGSARRRAPSREVLARRPRPDPVATLTGVVDALAAHPDNPASEPDAARGRRVARDLSRGRRALRRRRDRPLRSGPPSMSSRPRWSGVAFGPPPLNVAKLEALIEAGIVDTTHAARRSHRDRRRADAALLVGRAQSRSTSSSMRSCRRPAWSVSTIPSSARLVAAGHARVLPGRRGIEVAADATCVGVDGSPTPGLAACGRPTEDSVIGNDTLSRASAPAARPVGRSRDRAGARPRPGVAA